MNLSRPRTTLLAAAIATALTLSACGEQSNDAAPRTDATVSSTTPPSTTRTDQMTADASSAAARANAAPTTRTDAVQKAENAGDRVAATAGDAALTAKVKTALMAAPGIDSLQIDVDTKDKRVTLTGEVDNAQNHQKALQVARGVEGVDGVVDRLTQKK